MMSMLRVIAALCCVLLPGLSGANAQTVKEGNSRPVITVGLIDTFSPAFYTRTYAPTLEHLIRVLDQYEFRVVEIDYRHIDEDVARFRPAFMVTSASDFVSLIDKFGAHQVATKRPQESKSVAHTVASTYVVRRDSPFETLADARGSKVAVSSTESFDGWLIAKGDITARFPDASHFFSSVISTEYGIPDVAQMIKMGQAEVGVLSTCEYEVLVSTGQIDPSSFRILDERSHGCGCVRSTEQYPDVVFSSLPNVDEDVTKDVTLALLSMPHASLDFTWTIANDFLPTYNLLKTLRMGPYKPAPWSLELIWRNYRTEILLVIGLLLAVVFHIVSINMLVRRRTAQVHEALAETEHFYKEAQSVRSKLLQVERLSIVSQLSSMFAHEIKQPIMNISLYVGALSMMLKKQGIESEKIDDVISRIGDEVDRSSQIVEHVRGYAKKSVSQRVPCSLAKSAQEVLRTMSGESPAELIVQADSTVLADPFELQFIVANFLKNARSAVAGVAEPKVVVKVMQRDGKAVVTVEDNGPKISDEAFAELGRAKMSGKADGLGFGLSIAVMLAEKMGGHIEFSRRSESGLAVSLVLTKVEDKTTYANEGTVGTRG